MTTSPSAARYQLISRRRLVGAVGGVLLSVAFALAVTPIATVERWLGVAVPVAGETAPYTVRLPNLGLNGGRIVVQRGEVVGPAEARLIAFDAASTGSGALPWVGRLVAFALLGVMLSAYLRTSQRGRLLQVQLVALVAFLAFAAAAKLFLLLTPLSAFLLPTGAVALLMAALVDRSAGIGCAVALGLLVAALTPFDAHVGMVLSTQGVAATLALARARKRRDFMLASLTAAAAAAGAYVGVYFLTAQQLPLEELSDPARSPLLAAVGGGLLSGPLAVLLRPAFQRAMGQLSKARLIELADLQNPLLKQIAAASPGTWQHSLAMANMAEIAANAIGANALLTRCGAYYHDLGKSLQPQYYIENITAGSPSPHDALAPEISADAIFSHVTEGVRMARAHGLPEPIIDFMHMHHGDGLLEYFWSKCLEQGNPKALPERAFRYPGVPPQSRETAILCIVDAVEAASRSLKNPDARAIEQLVQRIVYGKLHLGQLDESGLSVADLKILAATLVETLKHAHHVRIEYPWQKEERARQQAAAAAGSTTGGTRGPSGSQTIPGTPEARDAAAQTRAIPRAETGRFVGGALDSADAPRPFWDQGAAPPEAVAPAVPVATPAPGTVTQQAGPTTGPMGTVTQPVNVSGPMPVVEEPPPPPRKTTIELMGEQAPAPPPDKPADELAPGVLVMGPPPSTHPEREPGEQTPAPELVSKPGPTVTPAIPPASTMPPRRRRPPSPPK